eukprot:6485440-Amphidinium_carterae.1
MHIYSAGEAAEEEEEEEEEEQGFVDDDGPTHHSRPISDLQSASSLRRGKRGPRKDSKMRFQEPRAGSAQRQTFYGGGYGGRPAGEAAGSTDQWDPGWGSWAEWDAGWAAPSQHHSWSRKRSGSRGG